MEVLVFNLTQLVIIFLAVYFICKAAVNNVMNKEEIKSDKFEEFIISLRDLDYIDNERMERMITGYKQKKVQALSEELFDFEENDFEFEVDSYIRELDDYNKRTKDDGIV